MGRVILVTSGKGGTGKSTLSVNCGMALSLLGKRVLLVDTDAGLRSLDIMLGVSERVVYDLSDILCDRCDPDGAIIETGRLSLLPAPMVAEDPESADAFIRLCRIFREQYDFVLLDSPAGMGKWARASTAAADQILLVVTPDPVCIRDADHMASYILSRRAVDIRLVVNRIQPNILRRKLNGGVDSIIDTAAVQLIGLVPEDRHVTLASYDGGPVVRSLHEHGGAAEAYCNIAHRLLGNDIPLMKF